MSCKNLFMVLSWPLKEMIFYFPLRLKKAIFTHKLPNITRRFSVSMPVLCNYKRCDVKRVIVWVFFVSPCLGLSLCAIQSDNTLSTMSAPQTCGLSSLRNMQLVLTEERFTDWAEGQINCSLTLKLCLLSHSEGGIWSRSAAQAAVPRSPVHNPQFPVKEVNFIFSAPSVFLKWVSRC